MHMHQKYVLVFQLVLIQFNYYTLLKSTKVNLFNEINNNLIIYFILTIFFFLKIYLRLSFLS